jgi:NAD-dependent deacetylase
MALTGAGISAESGVPTFRGEGGLWNGLRAVDLATPEAFARDPRLVWEFYNWRRELLAPLRPNAAHNALAELEGRIPGFTLATQNIDGLHQLAGSSNMLELHGNIWRVRCTKCGGVSENREVPLPPLPACTACGGLLRPHVVWFGESLNPVILQSVYQAIEKCEVMLVIGTSGVVQPAASMGLHALQRGAFVAEINLEPTPYSSTFSVSIQGKAGDIAPQLLW